MNICFVLQLNYLYISLKSTYTVYKMELISAVIQNVEGKKEQTDTVCRAPALTLTTETENHVKYNVLLQLDLAENEAEVQRRRRTSETDDRDAQRKRQ